MLKGANLFYAWTGQLHRPTRDLDMLRYGTTDPDRIEELIREVLDIDVEDDGIFFAEDTISATFIREDDVYGGIRVKLRDGDCREV